MPNAYKARVDVRRFLNLPDAYVVAYVEDTSGREITKRDLFGYEGRPVAPEGGRARAQADREDRVSSFASVSDLSADVPALVRERA